MSAQTRKNSLVNSGSKRSKRRRNSVRSQRRRSTFDLLIESLEDRLTPSAGPLGVATDFNVFVLHNMTAGYTDSEGRVAVGGNASFTSFGIGNDLANSHSLRDDLIVGGNLTYQAGQVFNGNVVYQGTANVNSLGLPNGTILQGSVIDFGAAETSLLNQSSSFAGLTANGVATINYGSLNLFGTDSSLNVFSVTTNDLATANGVVIDAPAGSDVVINVSGTAGSMHNFVIDVNGTDKSHVFYNFFDATSLDIHSISVQGSVLAPLAAVSFNNGNIEGTMIASSLAGTGEYHNLTTPPIPTPPPIVPLPMCLDDALGIATDYNLFVFDDAALSYSDSEGRVAIGGNATFTGYGVGDRLSNSFGTRDDLIVDGNLTFTNGQVFNGNIVYGGTASLSSYGIPNGSPRLDSVIDFTAAESSLVWASATYASIYPNGTVSNLYGTLNLTGANPVLNIFSMSASDLASANFLGITAPAGSTVLINISGMSAQMQNFVIDVNGPDNANVLFNFYEATSLLVGGISVQGSVLAPHAAVTFANGNIEGTLVAKSVSGSGEMHNIQPELHICVESTLSGYVYNDANTDGLKQSGESGIAGATLSLTGIDTKGNPVSLATTTNGSGYYTFSGLLPGTYTITETQPDGYLDGIDTIGTPGGTTTNDKFSAIPLTALYFGDNNNFGELQASYLLDDAGDLWLVLDSGKTLMGQNISSYDTGKGSAVFALEEDGDLIKFDTGLPGSYSILDSNVQSFRVAGNGDVYALEHTGSLYQFLGGSPSYNLFDMNVKTFDLAGDGITVYALEKTGNLYQNTTGTVGAFTLFDTDVQSFSVAGDTVFELRTNGNLYLFPTGLASNFTVIDPDAASFAVGANGSKLYVHEKNGNLYQFAVTYNVNIAGDDTVSAPTLFASEVDQFSLAEDGVAVYVLDANGDLYQFATGTAGSFTLFASDVQTFKVAGNQTTVYALQENGDLNKNATGLVGGFTLFTPSVGSFEIAGNGVSVYALRTDDSTLYKYVDGDSAFGTVFDTGVSSFALAGNGQTVYTLDHDGKLYQFVGGSSSSSTLFDENVQSFELAGNGTTIYVLEKTGNLYKNTDAAPSQFAVFDLNVRSFDLGGDGVTVYTHGQNNNLYQFETGQSTSFIVFDGNVKSFALTGNGHTMYVLEHTGNLYQYARADSNNYTLFASNADEFSLAGNGVTVYVLKQDDTFYQYINGQASQFTLFDEDVQSFGVAHNGKMLYTLGNNGNLYQFADANSGVFTVLDQNVIQFGIGSDGSLFILESSGVLYRNKTGASNDFVVFDYLVASFTIDAGGSVITVTRTDTSQITRLITA